MNLSTGARLFDDTSLVQYAAPRAVRTRIDGRERTVRMGVNTLCCRTDAQLLRDTGQFGGAAVMLDRPLTAAEKRRFSGRLVWIDGDVLVAQPDNPRCTTGMSLSHVRALLEHPVPSGQRVYAPASPYDGARVVLFGIPAKNTNDPAYGKGVQIVNEQSSIAAVAGDPDAVTSTSTCPVPKPASSSRPPTGAIAFCPDRGREPRLSTSTRRGSAGPTKALKASRRRLPSSGYGRWRRWRLHARRSGSSARDRRRSSLLPFPPGRRRSHLDPRRDRQAQRGVAPVSWPYG